MLFNIVDFNNEDISYIYNKRIDTKKKVDTKNKNEDNVCFICYEEKLPSLKLKNINCYTKNCECNIDIHKKCLDEWYNKNSTCPICIKFMYKKIDKKDDVNKNKNTKIIIFVKQNINILFNLFLFFFTLNCFYKLYLSQNVLFY